MANEASVPIVFAAGRGFYVLDMLSNFGLFPASACTDVYILWW